MIYIYSYITKNDILGKLSRCIPTKRSFHGITSTNEINNYHLYVYLEFNFFLIHQPYHMMLERRPSELLGFQRVPSLELLEW